MVKLSKSIHLVHTLPKVWRVSGPSPPIPLWIGVYKGTVVVLELVMVIVFCNQEVLELLDSNFIDRLHKSFLHVALR